MFECFLIAQLAPRDCRFFTQNQWSSIFNSSFNVVKPVQTEYTYRNFRFAPDFTLDTVRDRMYGDLPRHFVPSGAFVNIALLSVPLFFSTVCVTVCSTVCVTVCFTVGVTLGKTLKNGFNLVLYNQRRVCEHLLSLHIARWAHVFE